MCKLIYYSLNNSSYSVLTIFSLNLLKVVGGEAAVTHHKVIGMLTCNFGDDAFAYIFIETIIRWLSVVVIEIVCSYRGLFLYCFMNVLCLFCQNDSHSIRNT